jgi:hypothetical protein
MEREKRGGDEGHTTSTTTFVGGGVLDDYVCSTSEQAADTVIEDVLDLGIEGRKRTFGFQTLQRGSNGRQLSLVKYKAEFGSWRGCAGANLGTTSVRGIRTKAVELDARGQSRLGGQCQ